MTGMEYLFLCFPLFLIAEEKANRVAALCSQKGEGNTLQLMKLALMSGCLILFSVQMDVFLDNSTGS